MSSRFHALSFAARQPQTVGRFWADFLGRPLVDDVRGGVTLPPDVDHPFGIRFWPAEDPKTAQNPMHFDLTSTSVVDQERVVARAVELGARHIDVGQLPEEGHVVLADPEGNEFCVIEPGNAFLAGCGFIGAIACDGSQEVGYFWSEALVWPLVWDQDEETAIQSPSGGTKITWGGPPVNALDGRQRLVFEIAADGDFADEIGRLVSIGAVRV